MGTNECTKCGKNFSTPTTLKNHLNRKTPCDKVMACEFCNKTFKVKASFDKHRNTCNKKNLALIKEEPKEELKEEPKEEPKEDLVEITEDLHQKSIPINGFLIMALGAELYSSFIKRAILDELNEGELQMTDELVEILFNNCLSYVISKHTKLNGTFPPPESVNVSISFTDINMPNIDIPNVNTL
jgi:hypothetical protein